MKYSTLCLLLYLKVNKHFNLTKNCKEAWMLTNCEGAMKKNDGNRYTCCKWQCWNSEVTIKS